jgi:cellulase/cellobiase CelA1
VVSFTVTSHWSGGYHAEVILDNTSRTPISDWKLTFRVGGAATVADAASTRTAMNGEVLTATPQDWNTTLAAGNSVPLSFEFNGAWVEPSDCSFDSQPCTLKIAVLS